MTCAGAATSMTDGRQRAFGVVQAGGNASSIPVCSATRASDPDTAKLNAQKNGRTMHERHRLAYRQLALAIAFADCDTREGRKRIALAFCRHAELTRQ